VLDQLPRERQLAIPMCAGNRSLNLSNAVALVVYEAWRQNGFAGSQTPARDR
jgi:tRNA (cytidine/uridine-2'-O-)-methyltransferase